MSQHRTSSFGPSRFVTDGARFSDFSHGSELPSFRSEFRLGGSARELTQSDHRYVPFDGFTEVEPAAEAATAPQKPQSSAPEPQPAPRKRGGAHRVPTPPAALKGRSAIVAVAAGAVVAAGQAAIGHSSSPAPASKTPQITLAGAQVGTPVASGPAATAAPQAAQFAAGTGQATPASDTTMSTSPQVLNVAAPVDMNDFANLLSKGQKFAQDRAAEEAAKLRPMFAKFSTGTFTSGFGSRWGAMHAGVDLANAIGTPILAVEDGEVIDAGPASGFGMWVRLKHADGTITVYGHIDSATVKVGQHVMAGDEIAKMGNRGFSTGPHCHFEVWLNGKDKIDPLPWLASRGISLGVEKD